VHLGWEVEVELSLKDGQEVTTYLTQEHLDQYGLQSQQQFISNLEAKAFALVPELEVLGAYWRIST